MKRWLTQLPIKIKTAMRFQSIQIPDFTDIRMTKRKKIVTKANSVGDVEKPHLHIALWVRM